METGQKINQRTRLLSWISVVSILFITAILIRIYHDESDKRLSALYGNTSETPFALQHKLDQTSVADQLPMLLHLANNHSAGLRYAVIDELGSRYSYSHVHGNIPPQVLSTMKLALQDDDTAVRQRAYEVLPELVPLERLPILFSGALSTNTWISEDCASLLSQWIEDHKSSPLVHNSVPGLMQMLSSRDQTVQQFAMTSLEIATGKPWRKSGLSPYYQREIMVNKWLAWWQKMRDAWKVPDSYKHFSAILPTRTDPCPNFSIVQIDGKIISLSQLKGHPFLLNFWGLDCGPCIEELPQLENVYQMDESSGLRELGIALEPQNHANEVANFCYKNGITYPQAIGTRSMQINFGDITEVPVTFLVNGQGQITRIWEGASPGPEPFTNAAKQLLVTGQ